MTNKYMLHKQVILNQVIGILCICNVTKIWTSSLYTYVYLHHKDLTIKLKSSSGAEKKGE
jgi:hypothetical protein